VSEFLRLAQTQGVKTLNGASMLFYQAYYADCLFLKKTPNAEEAKAMYERYLCTEK
jgi:shikimate 5-dehydrogenase